MANDRINTGATAVLKSLSAAEESKGLGLVRLVVAYAGWFLILFVWGIYLISPELRAKGLWIYGWLVVCVVYQIVLVLLSRTKKKSYETPEFRMARIQVMALLASALLLLTGGTESYFWFIYLGPLFASAIYFSWAVTWGIYGEIAVLYFLSSLLAVRGLAQINFALLLTNLAVLLVLTVVLRYLVESIRKYKTAEKALVYSGWFQNIQQDVDTAISLQDVLDRILKQAVKLVGARDGSLMLMEEDGRLYFHARVGGLFPLSKEGHTFMPGAPDEGIAGWVARNCKPYVCPDTEIDTQFVDIVAGFPIRSLVSVPIISHGIVLGVINVDSPEPNCFSSADAELLVTMAAQVAGAIERATLLECLKQISEKTVGGAEELYQHIVDAVHRLTNCPVAMWRVDVTGKQARIVAFQGVRAEHARKALVDLDRSVTGRAIREGKTIQVLDIKADPDFQNKEEAALEGWQSMLAVPLLVDPKRAIGTLNIYSRIRRDGFTSWELDILNAFAGQAGVIIRMNEEMKVLNELGRDMSVLGVESLAQLVYQKTSQLMDTTNFFLCLYSRREEKLDFKVWIYDGKPLAPFSDKLSGLTGWIIQKKKPLLIKDWDKEEGQFPVKADIVTSRQKSWLGVPLLVAEEVVGVISVQSPMPYAFNLDTQRLLETIASQAAISIKNAQAYEQRSKDIAALQEVNVAITTKSWREIAELIVQKATELTQAEYGGLWIVDQNRLVLGAMYGRQPCQDWLPIDSQSINGWVAISDRSCNCPNVKEDPRYLQWYEDVQSNITVPLRFGGQVIGTLYTESRNLNAFSEDQLRLLQSLGDQAAVAIENTRLFRRIQEQSRRIQEQRIAELETLTQLGDTLAVLEQEILEQED